MDRVDDSRRRDGRCAVHPPGHERRIGEFQSISFWCDDVSATAEGLKKKGVVFTQAPKTEQWGTSAKFKDPDGNQFVLSSRGKQK